MGIELNRINSVIIKSLGNYGILMKISREINICKDEISHHDEIKSENKIMD